MSSSMMVQVCRGRVLPIPLRDEPKVRRLVLEAAQRLVESDIDWCRDFFPSVAESVSDDLVSAYGEEQAEQHRDEKSDVFIEVSRWHTAKAMYEAAMQLYCYEDEFDQRTDVAVLVLDDKPWFVTGGVSWGDDPTEATPLVHMMSWSGLDSPLSELGLISDLEYLARHVREGDE